MIAAYTAYSDSVPEKPKPATGQKDILPMCEVAMNCQYGLPS